MLQNAYLLAKIGADTAENEQHFANRRFLTSPRIVPLSGPCSGRAGDAGLGDEAGGEPRRRRAAPLGRARHGLVRSTRSLVGPLPSLGRAEIGVRG